MALRFRIFGGGVIHREPFLVELRYRSWPLNSNEPWALHNTKVPCIPSNTSRSALSVMVVIGFSLYSPYAKLARQLDVYINISYFNTTVSFF